MLTRASAGGHYVWGTGRHYVWGKGLCLFYYLTPVPWFHVPHVEPQRSRLALVRKLGVTRQGLDRRLLFILFGKALGCSFRLVP